MDIANHFKDQNINTTCAAFIIGEPLESLFASHGIPLINLIKNPLPIIGETFDLIWAHHWPVLGYCTGELFVQYRYLVSSSLSPYEPLEITSVTENIASALVYNSESTRRAHLSDKSATKETNNFVLKNSLGDEWFADQTPPDIKKLESIAVISNHIPLELQHATNLLESLNVQTTLIGLEAQQRLVDLKTLKEFSAVVSIGHTVQKGLALGIPVYCYDRFGGPGWINMSNIDDAEYENFSGRCCFRQLTGDQLATEIKENFTQTLISSQKTMALARERYRLSKNIDHIICRLEITNDTYRLDTNSTLRKLTQLYIREKFDIEIPSTANVTSNTKEDILPVFISYTLLNRNNWITRLAHFSITSIPTLTHENYRSEITIRGIALTQCSPIAINLVNDNFLLIASTVPTLPTPLVGQMYPQIVGSKSCGFKLTIPSGIEPGTYKIVATIEESEELPLGEISLHQKQRLLRGPAPHPIDTARSNELS